MKWNWKKNAGVGIKKRTVKWSNGKAEAKDQNEKNEWKQKLFTFLLFNILKDIFPI